MSSYLVILNKYYRAKNHHQQVLQRRQQEVSRWKLKLTGRFKTMKQRQIFLWWRQTPVQVMTGRRCYSRRHCCLTGSMMTGRQLTGSKKPPCTKTEVRKTEGEIQLTCKVQGRKLTWRCCQEFSCRLHHLHLHLVRLFHHQRALQ